MIDPSFSLQTALYESLTAENVLPPGVNVYDDIPEKAKAPYVILGDCQILPDKAGCIDGVEAYPILNIWSTASGYKEAKTIAAAIIARLDDKPENLSVSGFSVIVIEIEDYHPFRDPDGITRHISLTFRVLLSPT